MTARWDAIVIPGYCHSESSTQPRSERPETAPPSTTSSLEDTSAVLGSARGFLPVPDDRGPDGACRSPASERGRQVVRFRGPHGRSTPNLVRRSRATET